MTVAYHEQQPVEKWINRLVWAAIGVYTFGQFLAIVLINPPLLLILAVVLSILVIVFAAYNFRTLNIQIEDNQISFGFGIFRKRLRWEEIRSVTLQPYLFSRFLGWGIRPDFRGTTGYIARRGLGVELRLKSGKRYFFSTWHPDELAEIIRAKQREQRKAQS